MWKRSYPAWAALLLLPTIFGYTLIRFVLRGQPLTVDWVIGGLTVALILGAVVFLLDRPGQPNPEDSEVDLYAEGDEHEGGRLVPRFLTFASILLFFIPVMGLVLALAALIANWNRPGWSRTISRITVGLAILATTAFASLMLTEM